MLWRGVLWLLLIVCLVPVAQAQEDYFVVASVSSSTPYVGQQVTYIFRLYSTVSRTNRGSVVDPSFDGFWEHEFNTVQQYNTIVNGQSYEVKERRVALYPTYAGNIRIDPTAFVIPDDPLQAGEVLFTEAVDVQVQPLPVQDDLVGFNGAVGQLEMQPTLDRQTTTVGEPLTLRLTVRGSANLEQLTAPQLPQTEAWRIYANPAAFVAEETEGLLVGEKTFEWLFTPLLAGQQNLPDTLQKQGGFIPGIRPGQRTETYLNGVLQRITLVGALFLGLVAVLPYLAGVIFGGGGINNFNTLVISSTGLLIVVGVVLDTMKQIEAQLMMRNYEGFIR